MPEINDGPSAVAKAAREFRAQAREAKEEEMAQKGIHVSRVEPIHEWFNLTYANYLVVNRAVLQSMPIEWQEDFVALLGEMADELGWAMELQPAIDVRILRRSPELIEEREECENCDGSGEDDAEEDGLCKECDSMGDISTEEERYETPEEVGVMTDPIPHYERGRVELPLLSDSIDDVMSSRVRMQGEWLWAKDTEAWHRLLGPKFDSGEKVEVIHHTGHSLPLVLEDDGIGTWEAEIVECESNTDNLFYQVLVTLHAQEDKEGKDTRQVRLHADQMRKVRNGR